MAFTDRLNRACGDPVFLEDLEKRLLLAAPDLAGTGFSLDYGIMNLGAVTADFTVANIGTAPAGGFTIYFYLSQDSTITSGDNLLASYWVDPLASGASFHGTKSLSPGTGDPFGGNGRYTLGMVLDVNNVVAESDETNNSNQGYGVDMAHANYGKKIFLADFEQGDGAMQVVNSGLAPVDGLWHLTTHRGGDANHSSSHSMHYGRYDSVGADWDYDVGHSAGEFRTKLIALPDEPTALAFTYFAKVEASPSVDDIRVQAYNGDTLAWETLLAKGSGLSADTAAWTAAKADLSAYAGKTVRLRFLFDSVNELNNNLEGWYVDDIAVWAVTNPLPVQAFRSLNYTSDYSHAASLAAAGGRVTFAFGENQTGGTFAFTTDHAASPVNPALAVYDAKTGRMLGLDGESGAGGDAGLSLTNTGSGNGYFVEAWDTEEDSTGAVNVNVDGSIAQSKTAVAINAAGQGSSSGTIRSNYDTGFFSMTAPQQANGTLDITVDRTSGTLRPRIQVWKNASNAPDLVVGSDAASTVAHMTGVLPGDVLYVSVADNTLAGAGNYTLSAAFGVAVPATLTSALSFACFDRSGVSRDALSADAYILTPGDIATCFFAGDASWAGSFIIAANAVGGSVDPVVAVYNAATGAQLGADDNSGGGLNARLTVSLSALTRYIVAVADRTGTQTGDVQIVITAPGTASPTVLPLNAAGDGTATGLALGANDTSFFQFVAPADADGRLDVTVTPTGGLDAAVALFDAAGNLLGLAFAQPAGQAETLSLTGRTAGATCYLSVLAANYASTGNYNLAVNFGQIVPDTYPGGADSWRLPDVHGNYSASLPVTVAGAWHGWLFAGNQTDPAAQFSVTGSAGLVPIVGLYNADSGARVAYNPNLADAATVSLAAAVSFGSRYYLIVTGRNASTGNALLGLDMAEMASTTLSIYSSGLVTLPANLLVPADILYYRFLPPYTAAYGDLTVRLTNPAPALKGHLALWNETAGEFLTAATAPAAGAAATLTYHGIQTGTTYNLAVCGEAFASGSGSLTLNFEFSVRLPGDANLDGIVDLQDFGTLKDNFNMSSATWADGDFTGDAVVDLQDFGTLKDNFNHTYPPLLAAESQTPLVVATTGAAEPSAPAATIVSATAAPTTPASSRPVPPAIPFPAIAPATTTSSTAVPATAAFSTAVLTTLASTTGRATPATTPSVAVPAASAGGKARALSSNQDRHLLGQDTDDEKDSLGLTINGR